MNELKTDNKMRKSNLSICDSPGISEGKTFLRILDSDFGEEGSIQRIRISPKEKTKIEKKTVHSPTYLPKHMIPMPEPLYDGKALVERSIHGGYMRA